MSLPWTLERFRTDLERAICREQSRRRRRRRVQLAIGAALAAAAIGVAMVLPITLPGPAPSVVERAAAALDPFGNTILHTKIAIRWVRRDSSVEIVVNEIWQERRPPYAQRIIFYSNLPDFPSGVGGHVVKGRRIGVEESTWSGFDTDVRALFDPHTHTIYVLRPLRDPHALRSAPRFCAKEGVMTNRQRGCPYPFFVPGPRSGTFRVVELTRLTDRRPFHFRVGSRIVSEKEAHRIMDRLVPTEPLPDPYRSEILDLLKRADVKVEGHLMFHGRDAIRITWNSAHSIYLVDARTYDPIRLHTSNRNGTRTTSFLTYETLPLNTETRRLVSLKAQHPTARISHDRNAFIAAEERLVPHG